MKLLALESRDILDFSNLDEKNIIEYHVHRTQDKRLILDLKLDVTHSSFEMDSFTSVELPK